MALDKIGVDVDTLLCPICGREVETVYHALVTWWNVDVGSANSWEELCERGNNIRSRRWLATVWCSSYFIWINRNKVVFEKANGELADFLFDLQLKTYEWVARKDTALAID